MSEESEVRKCEDLWFSDGNIILETNDTRFRVHRSILVKNSSVFQDILSIEQSPIEELFEGQPVIRVHDSSQDMRSLLSVIYQPRFWRPETDFATLAAVLKLSSKYDIPHLHRDAISRLSNYYPTTLDAWDNRPERKNPFPPFEALHLARWMDIAQVLPSLFLDCATVPMALIVDQAKAAGCSENDISTCIQGRQRLLEVTLTRIYNFCESCDWSSQSCNSAKLCWLQGRLDLSKHGWMPFAIKIDWNQYGACESCRKYEPDRFKNLRQEVWNDLPSYFNLSPWPQEFDEEEEEEEEEDQE